MICSMHPYVGLYLMFFMSHRDFSLKVIAHENTYGDMMQIMDESKSNLVIPILPFVCIYTKHFTCVCMYIHPFIHPSIISCVAL